MKFSDLVEVEVLAGAFRADNPLQNALYVVAVCNFLAGLVESRLPNMFLLIS